jgi:hypothetical protein
MDNGTLNRQVYRKKTHTDQILVQILTQHSTAQHSTAQHSTAQHSTAQHSTAQHNTTQRQNKYITADKYIKAIYMFPFKNCPKKYICQISKRIVKRD